MATNMIPTFPVIVGVTDNCNVNHYSQLCQIHKKSGHTANGDGWHFPFQSKWSYCNHDVDSLRLFWPSSCISCIRWYSIWLYWYLSWLILVQQAICYLNHHALVINPLHADNDLLPIPNSLLYSNSIAYILAIKVDL